MATITVKSSGGDYATLALACNNASDGDTISIEGTWSADDTSAATLANDNVTIEADSDSKTPGYVAASPTNYRLVVGGGSHALTVTGTGCTVRGIEIDKSTSTNSDECIRVGANSVTLTVDKCLLHGAHSTNNSDGIYTSQATTTLNVTNCVFYNFYRTGIHVQRGSTPSSITINANSCTFHYIAADIDGSAGAIGTTNYINISINVFNCLAIDCSRDDSAADFRTMSDGSNPTWDIHNSIDSDGSIDDRDSAASGCLTSRSGTDSDSPGTGDWVVFEDLIAFGGDHDLRLKTNVENDAEGMHSTSSGAGLSMPSTDIAGNTRSAPYCCGAFELGGASGTTYQQSVSGSAPAPSGTLSTALTWGQAVSGDMPAAQGALIKKIGKAIAGGIPAPTGDIPIRVIGKSLSGALDAPTGTVIKKTSRIVSGAVPSPAGTVAGVLTNLSQAVYGAMPAPVGDIIKKIGKVVSGVTPSPSGGITEKKIGKQLTGAPPAPSGDLDTTFSTSQGVSGEMPAPYGLLSTIFNPIATAGANLLKIIGGGFKKLIG